MNFTAAELKKLALPLLLLVALLGAGAGLILWVQSEQKVAERQLTLFRVASACFLAHLPE